MPKLFYRSFGVCDVYLMSAVIHLSACYIVLKLTLSFDSDLPC